jgi:acyl-CoA thioesterase FadM
MNLVLRILLTYLAARTRPPCDVFGPSRLGLRVMPTDIDVLRHVNNGVYFSMLDLARVDMMVRSGIAAKLREQGWYPVVAAETMRFRRSLKLFERFDIETRVLGWDDKAFLFEHRFVRRGEVVAEAVVRVRVLKRAGGSVSSTEVLALAEKSGPSPSLPDWIDTWNAENGGTSVLSTFRQDSRVN